MASDTLDTLYRPIVGAHPDWVEVDQGQRDDLGILRRNGSLELREEDGKLFARAIPGDENGFNLMRITSAKKPDTTFPPLED